jgi:hypothetical protein
MSRFLKSMIVLLAIAAIATPAFADDYKFSVYGSARTATFYSDYDQADNSDFQMNVQGNARFGLKASKGDVSGHYEMSVTAGNLRLMYGTWDFGGGKLIVGQNYTAFGAQMLGNSVYGDDADFIGYGAPYDSRKPQIQVALDNGLAFYLVQNASQTAGTDANLPKLNIKYDGKAGNFKYSAAGGYQSYDDGANDYTSYVLAFMGMVDLKPATIKFVGTYGVNTREFGLALIGTNGDERVAATADEDATMLGGYVEVAMKANDMNTIRAGIGYTEEDSDAIVQKETRMAYYVHDQITLAPGFYVVPEIAFFDGMDDQDGSDGEQSVHVGAKWQINF